MRITELRQKTQSTKVDNRERPWLYRSLQRGPSIYITAVLLKTRITPNQITFLSIVSGVVGFFFVLLPAREFILIGILFFYFAILLDKVDGELARYRETHSLKGIYLDNIHHLVLPSLFFIGVTMHTLMYRQAHALFVFAGMLGAVGLALIRTGWSLAPQIYAKKYMRHPERFAIALHEQPAHNTVAEIKKRHTLLHTLLSIVHQFQEFFMILLVFFLVIIAEMAFNVYLLRIGILFFGGLLVLVLIENTIKGYLSVEHRIADLHRKFDK